MYLPWMIFMQSCLGIQKKCLRVFLTLVATSTVKKAQHSQEAYKHIFCHFVLNWRSYRMMKNLMRLWPFQRKHKFYLALKWRWFCWTFALDFNQFVIRYVIAIWSGKTWVHILKVTRIPVRSLLSITCAKSTQGPPQMFSIIFALYMRFSKPMTDQFSHLGCDYNVDV